MTESYVLPSNYQISLANENDDWKIFNYGLLIYKNFYFAFLGYSYVSSLFFMISSMWHKWEHLQKTNQFETGIEPLTHPDLSGYLYIIFGVLRLSLNLSLLLILFFSIACFFQYLFYSQSSSKTTPEPIEGNWIITYQDKIVGECTIAERKKYSRLITLSVHPKHRNLGLKSCLLQQATRNAIKPIYLFCLAKSRDFYQRLGFVCIPWRQIPIELKPVPCFTIMALSENQ